MKRVLFLAATLSAVVVSSAVMAQTARTPAAVDRVPAAVDRTAVDRIATRPDINIDTIAQRLRDRGLAEDVIIANIERIRAAIQSGKYPHLARRVYNATHPNNDSGVDPARRRADTDDRTPTDVTTFDRASGTVTVTPRAVGRAAAGAVATPNR